LLVFGGIAMLYAARTVVRNPDWHDDFTLNKAGAEDTPRCLGTSAEYGRLCVERARATNDPVERNALLQAGYEALQRVVALDTCSPAAMPVASYALGTYFVVRNKQYDSAVYYYDRAARNDSLPTIQYMNYNTRGDSALAAQRYDRALAMYEASERFGVQPEVAKAKIGIVYLLTQRYDLASNAVEAALRLNPNYTLAQQLLAQTRQLQKRQQDSLAQKR
jgi:tetratricopeptide (TPR) repeat protein